MLDGKSLNITELKVNQLKELFPEIFSENKIDFEKLKQTIGKERFAPKERYNLDWAGKTEAYKILQQPTTATLMPEHEKSINFETSGNIFIEGENLEVLKVLQKSYFGKVKMIYIDPPYNTGNDSFIYPDKFSETKDEYLKRIDAINEDGFLMKEGLFRKNSKENGQYHSNWLSMILPRLYIARNLLRDDGVIFVSIDDNEVHNLRIIMNEVFGEENFICPFIREAIKGGSLSKYVRETHDYILVYAKSINELEFLGFEKDELILNLTDEKGLYAKGRELNKWGAGSRREDAPGMWYPIKGPNGENVYPIRNDGSEGRWRLGKEKMKKIVEADDVIFEKRKDGTYVVYEKLRANKNKYKQFISILKDKYLNAKATEDLKVLFNKERAIFDFSKPSILIKDLLVLSNLSENDIILDFFAGSGTTAQAVLELNREDGGNRKFICVQLPEKTEPESEANKAGYVTIADITRERIKRVINKIQTEQDSKLKLEENNQDLGFKSFKLVSSNFKQWRSDLIENEEDLQQMRTLFETPQKPLANEHLIFWELLIKSGYELTIKTEKLKINNHTIYRIESNYFILITIDEQAIDEILKLNPRRIIALDSVFHGQDCLKTNIAEQCRQSDNIEFVGI